MSEAKKEEEATPKKKKGKLPLIIALVAILGGGGFFVMKGKGGKKAAEPAIKLGAIEPVPEFLVNLTGGQTYLRTQIALQFKEGFHKEELDKNLPAVLDGVIAILTTRSANELRTLQGKRKLKKDIAYAVNKVFESSGHEEPSEEKSKETDKDKKKPAKVDHAEAHEDWDSQEGPCLKVFFTSFAMQ